MVAGLEAIVAEPLGLGSHPFHPETPACCTPGVQQSSLSESSLCREHVSMHSEIVRQSRLFIQQNANQCSHMQGKLRKYLYCRPG